MVKSEQPWCSSTASGCILFLANRLMRTSSMLSSTCRPFSIFLPIPCGLNACRYCAIHAVQCTAHQRDGYGAAYCAGQHILSHQLPIRRVGKGERKEEQVRNSSLSWDVLKGILTLWECAAFKVPATSTVKITINYILTEIYLNRLNFYQQ